jgi:hypothetical protein
MLGRFVPRTLENTLLLLRDWVKKGVSSPTPKGLRP